MESLLFVSELLVLPSFDFLHFSFGLAVAPESMLERKCRAQRDFRNKVFLDIAKGSAIKIAALPKILARLDKPSRCLPRAPHSLGKLLLVHYYNIVQLDKL